ncbi:hypothetical protein M514_12130 [Trichuris suis]|uniref:Uncharacterized protein n=1 Tax=Trichuris suis TaxID=68888 RepID=A0A085LPV4_9BILA|nr:hypothetical protein M513_12130 [Trichuris suis]KFD61870.1 hypothetical protein M514_12130 [Trichuris suis]
MGLHPCQKTISAFCWVSIQPRRSLYADVTVRFVVTLHPLAVKNSHLQQTEGCARIHMMSIGAAAYALTTQQAPLQVIVMCFEPHFEMSKQK